MLSDVWSNTSFDQYELMKESWDSVKESDLPCLRVALKTKNWQGNCLEDLIVDYLHNFSDFSSEKGFLLSSEIYLMFDAVEDPDSAFFTSMFERERKLRIFPEILVVLFLNIIIIIIFFMVNCHRWRDVNKLVKRFKFLSKSAVKLLAVDSETHQLAQIARKSRLVGSPIISNRLLALIVTLVGCNLIWLISLSSDDFIHVQGEKSRRLFKYYADTDMAVLWYSFANLLLSLHVNNSDAAVHADRHLSLLFYADDATDFLRLFSPRFRETFGLLISSRGGAVGSQEVLVEIDKELSTNSRRDSGLRHSLIVRRFMDYMHLLLVLVIGNAIICGLNEIGFFEITELERLWKEFHSDRNEPEILSKCGLDEARLPVVLLKVTKNGRIVLSTGFAERKYGVVKGMKFEEFARANFVGWRELVTKALEEDTEHFVIENGDLSVHIFKDKRTFVYVERPLEEEAHDSLFQVDLFVRKAFPLIKDGVLERTEQFRVPTTSILFLRLVNLGKWADVTESSVSQRFLRDFIRLTDLAAEANEFSRVFVDASEMCFVNETELQRQMQTAFFKVSIQFGRELRNILTELKHNYGIEENLYASIVFYKGNRMSWRIEKGPMVQTDLFGEMMNGRELVRAFGIDGIGFGVGHKEKNRFPNMTRLKVVKDLVGREYDLFVVV
jgi:hypothetical protein